MRGELHPGGRRSEGMHRFTVVVLLVVSACATSSTPTTSEPPPLTISSTTTTTTAPTTTTSRPALEPSAPAFDTWAIVLASLATDEARLEDALERAAGYDTPAEVLRSDDYPSLTPGFWVVYNGPYDSRFDAELRCDALGAASIDCYPRYLGVALDTPVGLAHGTALVSVEGGYGIVALEDGTRLRTIEVLDEARYRLQPQLALGGSAAFFEGNVEDYWHSCESAQGFIDRLDLATGTFEQIARGSSLRVGPDGRMLAYAASSRCIDDPIDSGFLAVPDTIVVLDLDTLTETRWEPAASAGVPESFVTSLAWGANASYLLATLGDGTLRRLEPAQVSTVAELPIVDAEFVEPLDLTARARSGIELFSGHGEASIVAHRWSSIGSGRTGTVLDVNELIEIDPRSGSIQRTVLQVDDSRSLYVSIDAAYEQLLAIDAAGGVLLDADGRFPAVTVSDGGADW